MDVNPDHPLAAQAFTPFRIPGGLLEATLVLIVGLAGHTLWEAVTATGMFANAPDPIRVLVIAAIVYLALQSARVGVNQWRRRSPGGIGPAIERIEP